MDSKLTLDQATAIATKLEQFKDDTYNSVDVRNPSIAANQELVIEFELLTKQMKMQGKYNLTLANGTVVYLNENYYDIIKGVDEQTGEVVLKRKLVKFPELKAFRDERQRVNNDYRYMTESRLPISAELQAQFDSIKERSLHMNSFFSLRYAVPTLATA